MYVITGATGHTGRVISEKLLAAGKKVRVVGRDENRLRGLEVLGAEPFVADATDAKALTKAFSGCEAAYVLIPPDITSTNARASQERVSSAVAGAIEGSGIEYAVQLSSVGADKPQGTGVVVGLHNFEEKLNAIPKLNVLHLRAGYFMENLLPQMTVIQTYGIVAGPLRPDLPLPLIATQDVGNAAADALLELKFSGKSAQELLGPRDVTYQEIAAIIGSGIGKSNLSYQQLPPVQFKAALVSMGISENVAQALQEMADALNSGHMKALEPRSAMNTTPTTLEMFVAENFAPAFRAAKASRAGAAHAD